MPTKAKQTPSITTPAVAAKYQTFPPEIRARLLQARGLIIAVGKRVDSIAGVQENLKWGEPSYTTISGSPVRLGWKKADPERFGIYFHCQSKLVSTFRKLYPDVFTFEGNRAITFHKDDPFPTEELEHCIELAHTYHRKLPRAQRASS